MIIIKARLTCKNQYGNGSVVERNDYYPLGMRTATGNNYPQLTTNLYKYNGKEVQTVGDLGFTDYGARMYDDFTGRWFVSDPLAEETVWSSPFSFNQNNPINRIDLTGKKDNPVYDTYGNFLGTNDLGLQGDAIIMDKSDFKQGMSLEESMSKHKGYNSFVSEDAKNKYLEAKNCKRNLKSTNNFNIVAKSIIIILLVLIFKLESCEYCDYTEYFGNGYYYRDEGGDIKEIFGSMARTPDIPPTVIGFDYNRDFIIAKQKPDLPHDILYDMNYLYKDGVDTFYWIISVKNYFGLGPLDKQEYEVARKKYGVPDKLKLE